MKNVLKLFGLALFLAALYLNVQQVQSTFELAYMNVEANQDPDPPQNCTSTQSDCNGPTYCLPMYDEAYDNVTGNYCCCLDLWPETGKTRW